MSSFGERTPVSELSGQPFASTCLLQMRFAGAPGVVGYGTGFHIGGGRIATAGHNLWSDVGERLTAPALPTTVQVFLGEGFYAGNPNLFWALDGSVGAICPHPAYRGGDRSLDLGYIQLPGKVPAAHLPLSVFPGACAVGTELHSSGFPTDLTPFGMCEALGTLTDQAVPQFHHRIMTAPGQSGSPICLSGKGVLAAIGIDLGVGDHEGDDNRALAVTPAILSWLYAKNGE